jgi:hypothetical protein
MRKIRVEIEVDDVGNNWPDEFERNLKQAEKAAAEAIRQAYLTEQLPKCRDMSNPIWASEWQKLERKLQASLNGSGRRARGEATAEDRQMQNRERQQRWRQRERERKQKQEDERIARLKAWQESPEGKAAIAAREQKLADMRLNTRNRLARGT